MIFNASSRWLLKHHQNYFQPSIRTIGLEWSTYMCGWTLPPSGYLVPADTMPLLTPFTTPITPVTHTLTPHKHTRIQKPKSHTLKSRRNERVHFLGYTHIYFLLQPQIWHTLLIAINEILFCFISGEEVQYYGCAHSRTDQNLLIR